MLVAQVQSPESSVTEVSDILSRFLAPHRAKVALLRWLNVLQNRRSVHLLHIGKTGGTAVKAAVRQSDVTVPLIIHPHEITFRDIAPGDKVTFFVRDPITRFVSGFYSRKRKGWPGHTVPWSGGERDAFERFATPNALAMGLDDEREQIRLAAEAAMLTIEHVRSSYWDWFIDEQFLKSRWDDIVFVGQQESLKDDFEALKKTMNWPRDLALPDDPTNAHQSPAGENRTLSDEAIGNLARWYAADYRFLELCTKRRLDMGHGPFSVEYTDPAKVDASTA